MPRPGQRASGGCRQPVLGVMSHIRASALGLTASSPQRPWPIGVIDAVHRLVVALALLTAAYAATAVEAPAASNKAIWGPVRMPDGSSAFPVYRDLGVRFLQLPLGWNDIAPQRPARPGDPADPAYRWPEEISEAIRMGRRYGIKIALMAVSSPAWANGGRSHVWAPGNRHYARFLTAASRKYPSVRHWMIWGEANRGAVFQPLPVKSPVGPRRYATLLRAGYRALKRRSPRNIVIGGMTFSFGEVYPRDFARWMRLPNGKPPPLDLYGHNPFTTRFPDLRLHGYKGYPGARDISDIDLFYRELRAIYRGQYQWFRRRGPRLWLSEFTVSSDRANRDFGFYVSRSEQARWLRAAYRIARSSPFVASLGWISLLDEPASDPHGRTFGLMTYEGERKPAYYAYKRAR
jgi:hypothetical protein